MHWLLAMVLACGGGTTAADAPPLDVTVTDPWLEMGLPLQGGNVVFSDGDMLTVEFSGGDVAVLGQAFRERIAASGYTLRADTSAGDLVSVTWQRDGTTLSLGVLGATGTTTVSLTRFCP